MVEKAVADVGGGFGRRVFVVFGGEEGLQFGVVGRHPLEEDVDQLDLVDVFGGVVFAVGLRGGGDEVEIVFDAGAGLRVAVFVAVIGGVAVADSSAVPGVVWGDLDDGLAYFDVAVSSSSVERFGESSSGLSCRSVTAIIITSGQRPLRKGIVWGGAWTRRNGRIGTFNTRGTA